MKDEQFVHSLQHRLQDKASSKTKAWWENYLKGASTFRGVPLPAVRSEVHTWWRKEELARQCSAEQQRKLALSLLRKPHREDKLAGMLLIQEILLSRGQIAWRRDLPSFARLFTRGRSRTGTPVTGFASRSWAPWFATSANPALWPSPGGGLRRSSGCSAPRPWRS